MSCIPTIDRASLRFSLALALAVAVVPGREPARGDDSLVESSGQFGFLETPEPAAGEPVFEHGLSQDWVDAVQAAPAGEQLGSIGMVEDHVHHGSGHVHHGSGCGTGISRDAGKPQKPRHEQPGDINRGDCPPHRYGLPAAERAGWPTRIHRFAETSITNRYACGYVGGGAAFGGRYRRASEGVWGMDYQGPLPHRRIWLGWTGGKSQGGEGVYQTDGHTGPSLPGLHH